MVFLLQLSDLIACTCTVFLAPVSVLCTSKAELTNVNVTVLLFYSMPYSQCLMLNAIKVHFMSCFYTCIESHNESK